MKINKTALLRISTVIMVCICGAGFFPIINFNPNNPVQFDIPIKLMILILSIGSCIELGDLETRLYSRWKILKICMLNLGMAGLGLIFRYLLEFGEVSNTYNFTGANMLFQLAFITLLPTMTMALKRKH